MTNLRLTIFQSGKLLRLADDKISEHLSPFALEKTAQETRELSRNSWKSGDEPGNQHLFSRSQLWGGKGENQPLRPPRFLAGGQVANNLWYVLGMSRTRGLFRFDLTAGKELRLFHQEQFDPHGLCFSPDGDLFTTRRNADGSMHIVRMSDEGVTTQVITDGDCIDENPFLSGSHLYYQTSGLGRNDQGLVCAQAATAIYRIDLQTGHSEVLVEQPESDFLLPKADKSGSMFFIRRPHQVPGEASFGTTILDVLLFPYRLIVAILGFLDVFSKLFGQSPLKTSGGPPGPEIDIRHKMILGRWVDLQKLAKSEGKSVAAPRDWVLIKRTPDGKEEIQATNVAWYDLTENGEVLVSNGYEINGPDGRCYTATEIIETFSVTR